MIDPVISTFGTALLTSGALWGGLQYLMTRRLRKLEHRKHLVDVENAEKDADAREVRYTELLAAAQRTAQATALESADKRYAALETDYRSVRRELKEVKTATGLVINAFENFLLRMRPSRAGEMYSVSVTVDEVNIARALVVDARNHLY